MENFVFTSLSIPDIRKLFRQELETYFETKQKPEKTSSEQLTQLLSIDEVAALLHLSKATVYSKHSKGELPGVCKRGKRLYFQRDVIINWIKESRIKSKVEIQQDAETFLKKKGGKNE